MPFSSPPRDEVRLVLRLNRSLLAMFLGLYLSAMALMPAAAHGNGNHAAAVACYNRGVQLFAAQRNAEAVAEFRNALALDALPNAHGPLGQLLFMNGDYAGAMPELVAATQMEPMNAALWCQLGIAASRTQRVDLMQTAFQQYLALEPNGSYSSEARRSLAIVHPHQAAATYVQEFKGTMRKWQAHTLNVFVPASAGEADKILIAAALQQWTKMAEGRLQFRLVGDESQAQIVFDWTNDRSTMESADELGVTALKMNGAGVIEHARITLLANVMPNVATPDEQARREFAVIMHELGHALGLQHSSEPGDIMCATVAPMGLELASTARDKNTLLTIYNN